MEMQEIKNKIISNQLSQEEIIKLLETIPAVNKTKRGSLMKNLIKGYVDTYTVPNMLKLTLEASLIFVVVVGIVILSYKGSIDPNVTAILIAFLLGFLFGKIKL